MTSRKLWNTYLEDGCRFGTQTLQPMEPLWDIKELKMPCRGLSPDSWQEPPGGVKASKHRWRQEKRQNGGAKGRMGSDKCSVKVEQESESPGPEPKRKTNRCIHLVKHVSASFCEKSQNIINQEAFLCWPSNSGIRKRGWFFTFHYLRNCLVRRLPCTEHRINQVAACHRSEHALTSQD